ncbi:MAG: phosphoribosylglycinamide formyltransferase [Flavobacteriales bacterium]
MIRLAVLASGSGTNAQRMVEHFKGNTAVEVALIGTDNPKAGVIQRAWTLGVPLFLFDKALLRNGELQLELTAQRIDLVVLAGFMQLIPAELIRAFPQRIVNIHPALLPKYGGKGMYGDRVHAAVIAAGEKESGITIHYVNERYDEGEHIAQFKCPVMKDDTVAALAERVHALEHAHYPAAVEAIAFGEREREGERVKG